MSVDEKNEGPGAESRAEGMGGKGPKVASEPSAPHAGGDTFRIGTKDDIRASGGEGGGGKTKPRDTLRDGTR